MSIFVTVSFQTIKIKYYSYNKAGIILQSFQMKEWLVPYKYVKKQKKRPHNEGVKLLRQVSYRLETYRAVGQL